MLIFSEIADLVKSWDANWTRLTDDLFYAPYDGKWNPKYGFIIYQAIESWTT